MNLPLPQWIEGMPPEAGMYIAFSAHPDRRSEKASVYEWTGKHWRHWSGVYDNAITHYMPTDLPGAATPSQEPS